MSNTQQNSSSKVEGGSKGGFYKYGNLDLLTAQWMLYDPDTKQGIRNPHAPISILIEARGQSRYRVLVDENLSPPPLRHGGMYRTVNKSVHQGINENVVWDSFSSLPPMHGEFGPRRGRKARRREAIFKLFNN